MKFFNKDLFKRPKIDLQFMPDFKEEKVQKFTTIILTLIALSFFGLFAINPTLSTITELNKELSDSNFVDKRLQEKINNLTVLQQKFSALQSTLPVIFAAVPKNPEVPLFVAQLQAVAQSSNVGIDNLQTFEVDATQTGPQKYSTFSFALTAEGSYNDLSNFLTNLSKMQRIIGIDTISVTKKSGTTSALQLILKGKTFFTP